MSQICAARRIVTSLIRFFVEVQCKLGTYALDDGGFEMRFLGISIVAATLAGPATAATVGLDVFYEAERTSFIFGGGTLPGTTASILDVEDGTALISEQVSTATDTTQTLFSYDGTTLTEFASIGTVERFLGASFGTDNNVVGRFDNGITSSNAGEVEQGGTATVIYERLEPVDGQEVSVSQVEETAAGTFIRGGMRDEGGTGNTFPGSGILVDDGTGFSVLVKPGDPIENQQDVNLSSLLTLDVNDDGTFVGNAFLGGAGVNFDRHPISNQPVGNSNALVIGDGTTLDVVAQGGQTTPDGQGVFSNFAGEPVINDDGSILFYATVVDPITGDVTTSLFLSSGGTITEVISVGDPMPGDTSGGVVRTISSNDFDLADDGTIVYTLGVEGGDLDGQVAVVRDAGGTQDIVAKTGDTIAGDDTIVGISNVLIDDEDTIYMTLSGGSTDDRSNSDPFQWTRTSSTYLANTVLLDDDPLTPVPLPAGAPLLLVAMGGLWWVRRRQDVLAA